MGILLTSLDGAAVLEPEVSNDLMAYFQEVWNLNICRPFHDDPLADLCQQVPEVTRMVNSGASTLNAGEA